MTLTNTLMLFGFWGTQKVGALTTSVIPSIDSSCLQSQGLTISAGTQTSSNFNYVVGTAQTFGIQAFTTTL
jgi:hypothetical protein